jgi:hypothetical protein
VAVDRGAIDAQLRAIGEGERWWEQSEFRDLPHILHEHERIQGLINGRLLGRRTPRVKPAGRWLIVVTDLRLICLKRERFARRQIDIVAGQIIRLQESSRLRSYQLSIETAERKYRIRIPKADAFRFAGALGPLMPTVPVQRLHPELEAWSWIPGVRAVAALPGVAGIVTRVSTLAPADVAPRAQVDRLEASVERLQDQVEQLQEQVAFLEDLLRARPGALLTSRPAPEPVGD